LTEKIQKTILIPVPLLAVSTDFGRFDNLVFAFALNAPFGLRSEYDSLGAQRYMSTNISLSSIHIGPYVAWQATPKIAIGVEFNMSILWLRLGSALIMAAYLSDPQRKPCL
jgi:long-chain fatty acid transport protein